MKGGFYVFLIWPKCYNLIFLSTVCLRNVDSVFCFEPFPCLIVLFQFFEFYWSFTFDSLLFSFWWWFLSLSLSPLSLSLSLCLHVFVFLTGLKELGWVESMEKHCFDRFRLTSRFSPDSSAHIDKTARRVFELALGTAQTQSAILLLSKTTRQRALFPS